jgi:hypothetical protein
MVARPGTAEAVESASRYPGLGLGLHVALTGGQPVLPPRLLPSLVDSRGLLPSKPLGLRRAAHEELRAEMIAQIERFQALADRSPTHLDVHHHAHSRPNVLEALVSVALEARLPVRGLPGAVATRLAAEGIVTPDHFRDGFYGDGATLPRLVHELSILEEGVTELMCHPGEVDEALRRCSSYVAGRERELQVLTAAQVRETLVRCGIELIHFGALGPNPAPPTGPSVDAVG